MSHYRAPDLFNLVNSILLLCKIMIRAPAALKGRGATSLGKGQNHSKLRDFSFILREGGAF